MTIADERREALLDLFDDHGHNGLDCRPESGYLEQLAALVEEWLAAEGQDAYEQGWRDARRTALQALDAVVTP